MTDGEKLKQFASDTALRVFNAPKSKKVKVFETALASLPPTERETAASWITAYRMTVPPKKTNGERVALMVAAGVFLVLLLTIAVLIPEPTRAQQRIFTTVMAINAGLCGIFIPGAIVVRVKAPGLTIRALSAAAFFVLVYFFLPAVF